MSQPGQPPAHPPLMQMMIALHDPLWAVFADCSGVFDKDATLGPLEPIFRQVIFVSATDFVDPNGNPHRIPQEWVSASIITPPKELKERWQHFVAGEEGHIDVARNFCNFVALTAETPNVGKWRQKCNEKRAKVEALIKAAYESSILVPSKALLAADGNPVN